MRKVANSRPCGPGRTGVSLIEAIFVIVLISASAAVGLSQFRRQPTQQREVRELTNAIAAQVRAARIIALREGALTLPPAGDFHSVVVAVRRRADDASQLDMVTERWSTDRSVDIKQSVELPRNVRIARAPQTIRFDEFGRSIRLDKNLSAPTQWRISHAQRPGSVHTIHLQTQTGSVRVRHPVNP